MQKIICTYDTVLLAHAFQVTATTIHARPLVRAERLAASPWTRGMKKNPRLPVQLSPSFVPLSLH